MTAAPLIERQAAGRAYRGVSCSADKPKPLFVNARVRGRVDVDGRALRIRAAGRSETRYPLERVSRVIAGPELDWSAQALRACFEHSIPVVVVSEDGTPLGSLQPALARASSLAEALEEVLERPDWPELYGCWVRAARMRMLSAWRREMLARSASNEPGTYAELVRRYVYGAPDLSALGEGMGICRGALHALAVEAIGRWGMKPIFWGCGGRALNLLADLETMLELRLLLEASGTMRSGIADEPAALRVLQAMGGALGDEVEKALLSLARRVRQVLAEWR